ncbi:MAG: OmpA family protein [Alphaproteobacteria bacterium]|nr:OmpA family protein [Alphaproteobacteria bacterium]
MRAQSRFREVGLMATATPDAMKPLGAVTPVALMAPSPRDAGPRDARPRDASPRPGPVPGPAPSAAQPQLRSIEDARRERREETRDGRTVIREGNRTFIREGDRTIVRRTESERFRRGARDVRTERRGDQTLTIAVRPNGIQIVTVTDTDGRLVRRTRRDARGRELVLIDNRARGPRRADGYYVRMPPPVIRIPRNRYIVEAERADPYLIYETLIAPPVDYLERPYSLDEVLYSPELRDRMPRVDLDTITFETGSWEVTPDQVDRLAPIAEAINRAIAANPAEVFLIEGHTDAVGPDIDNLSLSDRRAESVAILLTEEFGVPPENLTTQGYGEQYLKVPTDGPERLNRRVTVRRITPLLAGEGPPR